jgi:hypothetical protein
MSRALVRKKSAVPPATGTLGRVSKRSLETLTPKSQPSPVTAMTSGTRRSMSSRSSMVRLGRLESLSKSKFPKPLGNF